MKTPEDIIGKLIKGNLKDYSKQDMDYFTISLSSALKGVKEFGNIVSKDERYNMSLCLLSILDSIKLYESGCNDEPMSEIMIRKMNNLYIRLFFLFKGKYKHYTKLKIGVAIDVI